MRITDLLDVKSIQLKGQASGKKEALDKMVDLMEAGGKLTDVERYRQGVYAREEESTTGIGDGIAIPHCKSDAVSQPGLAAMVVPEGVEFDSLDGQPVHLIFLIAAPNTENNVHLDVLSRLSMLLMDEDFTKGLKNAGTAEEFLQVINKAENARMEQEKAKESEDVVKVIKTETPGSAGAPKRILAVTGCPTGIAHTYMAAEALEKKAKELGHSIKVETRGSGGTKNLLTDEEIAEADGIIVAADTKVPMERFVGHRVVVTKVADGINKAEKLIEEALSGKAAVYEGGSGETEESDSGEKESIGHAVYKHLMSGVSHMLPFVIGGGIMVAIAFLIDTICGYGSTGGGNFGTCTPLSALFKYIGDLSMGMMVPVLAGYIAYSIADRPGLAVGFAGGLLAANGNAVLANYIFGGNVEGMGGFSRFIANFAFVGENSGNTVSGFLGGIVAGFLAGFVVLGLKKLCSKLPDSLDGIKPTLIYPLVGIFVVGILMCMIFNPLIGLINTGLSVMLTGISDAGMITVLGLILGAMMAIDMGGPINKAAYVFGTGMLATATDMMNQGAQASDPAVQACYIAMAAIMVGGMVPPVGIAVACRIFAKKFTKAERGSAVSNIVMGCSFITEGAIPFAASDPLHVIPCTMVGAGVAGFLSALFGCTLMAPHGGVFVFATVGQPILYIVAWLVGSAVTAVMLGFLKKDVAER
ncbi:MAG: PTS sugar transporter subunit IIA [Lachnospiraceae bacterium]|nr:PTS sugar transporter subunit IIA [Lachnospiraceae bacterium]